jgi:hypothetical protein
LDNTNPRLLWIPIGVIVGVGWIVALALILQGDRKGREASDAVERMTEYSERMCACRDKRCADGVQDEFTKWGMEEAKKATRGKDAKPSADLMKRSSEVMTRYSECMTKLMMQQ